MQGVSKHEHFNCTPQACTQIIGVFVCIMQAVFNSFALLAMQFVVGCCVDGTTKPVPVVLESPVCGIPTSFELCDNHVVWSGGFSSF